MVLSQGCTNKEYCILSDNSEKCIEKRQKNHEKSIKIIFNYLNIIK